MHTGNQHIRYKWNIQFIQSSMIGCLVMLSNIISRDDNSGRFDRNTIIPIGISNAVIRVETLFGW